jgi:RND superfamily putative drug exporter
MAGGTDELVDGTEQVADGTQQAADSIDELRDGLTEASDYLMELGDKAGDPSVGGFYLPDDAFADKDLVTAVDLFLSSDSKTARLFVLDKVDAQERPAAVRIAEVENATHRALAGTPLADAEVYITGTAPFNVDLHDLSQADFWLVATVALIAVLIILMVMLRSLVAPLFLVASVVLSYAAAVGLGVLVWQKFLGHQLDWTVPSIAFVMLVAVGADYNLLLMTRIQEESADGSRAGIGRALAVTGGVITAAGIIFAASMFAMMTAEAVGLAQTGFTIGMGLLIDTFIVRTFIVPSAAALLGPAMWWPRRTQRVVPMDELLRDREYATST